MNREMQRNNGYWIFGSAVPSLPHSTDRTILRTILKPHRNGSGGAMSFDFNPLSSQWR
jgi:hypothetical protein